MLIGTWADAVWAIRFYERHGFAVVDRETKDRLLRSYWTVPERADRDVGGAGRPADGCNSMRRAATGFFERSGSVVTFDESHANRLEFAAW